LRQERISHLAACAQSPFAGASMGKLKITTYNACHAVQKTWHPMW